MKINHRSVGFCETARKVRTLVGRLSESGEGYTAVKCAEAFFTNDRVCSVGSIAIPWYFERIGEGVLLGL